VVVVNIIDLLTTYSIGYPTMPMDIHTCILKLTPTNNMKLTFKLCEHER